MNQPVNQPNNPCGELVCEQFPELEWLNYCHGQMLSAQDFVDEQKYFLNKIALLTRCLQGYGVVCGLVVSSKPDPRKSPNEKYDTPDNYLICVNCGMAVDSRGREIVLRSPFESGLRELLDQNELQKFDESKAVKDFSLFLTIEYHAQPTGNQPLPTGGCCGHEPTTIKNRWAEKPCIRLTFDRPPGQSCGSCCEPVKESRIWLAELKFSCANKPILNSIDNTIRRPITTYQTTKVSGTNWLHTGVYEEKLAECLLTNGLVIRFSSPIDEQSIKNHEVRLEEGGKPILTNDLVEVAVSDELDVAKNNPLHILQARIEPIPSDDKKVREIRVKVETHRLSPPLRILINVRTEFILDTCCHPVDGSNRGGNTHYLGFGHENLVYPEQSLQRTKDEHSGRFKDPKSCSDWQVVHRRESGNGASGSNFQSWFYVVGDGCLPCKENDAKQS